MPRRTTAPCRRVASLGLASLSNALTKRHPNRVMLWKADKVTFRLTSYADVDEKEEVSTIAGSDGSSGLCSLCRMLHLYVEVEFQNFPIREATKIFTEQVSMISVFLRPRRSIQAIYSVELIIGATKRMCGARRRKITSRAEKE